MYDYKELEIVEAGVHPYNGVQDLDVIFNKELLTKLATLTRDELTEEYFNLSMEFSEELHDVIYFPRIFSRINAAIADDRTHLIYYLCALLVKEVDNRVTYNLDDESPDALLDYIAEQSVHAYNYVLNIDTTEQ